MAEFDGDLQREWTAAVRRTYPQNVDQWLRRIDVVAAHITGDEREGGAGLIPLSLLAAVAHRPELLAAVNNIAQIIELGQDWRGDDAD